MNREKAQGFGRVIKGGVESAQRIQEDTLGVSGTITPSFDFEQLLRLYYTSSYHRLCVNIKSRLLSCIEESDLSSFLTQLTPARFLRKVVLDLELFGNAFVEVAGARSYKALYHLPAREARVGQDGESIFQLTGWRALRLEGKHLAYDSPRSRFYGEPDYIAAMSAMIVNRGIDEYNAAFFENGATPRMAIVFENSEPSEDQISAFSSFFRGTFKGAANAHKTLILSAPSTSDGASAKISFERLSEVNDLSFERLKNLNRDEIVAAHGVPPRLVGVVNNGGLGGSGELIGQLHAFNEIHVKPKIELIEEFFRDELGVKVVLKPLDVTNFRDDAEVIPELVRLGILTEAEAKNILGWNKGLSLNGAV